MLPNVALAADIGAGQKLLEIFCEVSGFTQLDVPRRLARDRRFPALQRTLIQRRVIRERFVVNLGHNFPVLKHAHLPVFGHAPDFDSVEPPFFEDAEHFLLSSFLGNQQHAFLRLAQHDFVCTHAGFSLRHAVHLDLDSNVPARAHFAGGAS